MPKGIYKRTQENRKNLSESHKGIPSPLKNRKRSQETRDRISQSMKGKNRKPRSEQIKKKISKSKTGIRPQEITRVRMSLAQSREKSHCWKGGISFEPYTTDWTDTLKKSIRERDHYICQLCLKDGYPVHHIDYNKKNCSPDNLITLCRKCHAKTNFNRDYWIKYFNAL